MNFTEQYLPLISIMIFAGIGLLACMFPARLVVTPQMVAETARHERVIARLKRMKARHR